MKKSLLYRLFGFGKISKELLTELKDEDIKLMDEGLKGSVTYKNFKAPGKYFSWKKQWYITSIITTNKRIIGLRGRKFIINIPFADVRIKEVNFSLDEANNLIVSFDPSLFNDDCSGQVEYKFASEQAKNIVDKLSDIQRNLPNKL